jgi:hypothetical protein
MPLQDGTPRVQYNEPRDSQGRPTTGGFYWPIAFTVAAIVVLLVILTGFFSDGEVGNSRVNAPSSTPPSVQQPDTSPPVDQNPSQ